MTAERLEIGLVLPMFEDPQTGVKPAWVTIEAMAGRAEEIGFDTVWVADELLWRVPSWPGPRGWWECVSMVGAVAAATSTIGVGTWVLSALHRTPALTVKVAETLDEIAGGRFVFGLGSGHPGDGAAFGFPEDKPVARYEEALQIIVPALRTGSVSWEGEHHQAVELEVRPRGPRANRIPLMLAGHGPRTMRLAARHADIWSGFATEASQADWFIPMLERLDEACAEVGRDPATLGRSIGVAVETADPGGTEKAGLGVPITGSPSDIADQIARFETLGVTQVEVMLWPGTEPALEALTPAIELLRR